MPNGLNKQRLINDILAVFDNEAVQETDAMISRQRIAAGLAAAIETYVKDAKIKYLAGLIAGTTVVTGTFNGNLE